MNEKIEALLLNFKELIKAEPKLTDNEIERFKRVSYSRIYKKLLDIENYGYKEILLPAASNKNNGLTIKAINPFLGEVIYEGRCGGARISLTSLGYEQKRNREGLEIYVKGPGLFEKKDI